jgi:hypothetical protein
MAKNKITAAHNKKETGLGTEVSRTYRVEGDRHLQMIDSSSTKQNM